jgi:misacylated tRNA(Ala) deacylase
VSTEQLYATDSYLRTFGAIVQQSGPDGIVLDRTAFYPKAGGQPSDQGELRSGNNLWRVTSVQRQAGEIAHIVDGELPAPGTPVEGILDWGLRFSLMRLHTALHALSGIVWRGWNANVTGSNIADNGERARMDFSLEGLRINEIKQEIEDQLNDELAVGREVKIYSLPQAEAFGLPDLIRTHVNLVPENIKDIRVVEIVGLDRQADGGTHVANTSEIGRVQIINAVNKGRINRRLEISLVDTN